MTELLELKEHLKSFYSKYEAYIVPVLKFLAAMAALLLVNGELGYMSELNSFAIVLVAALFCSFLPMNFIILFAALFSVGHIYRLSLECAVGVLVLFMLLFFLYFRFSPKDTIVVVLTPVCFALKVPAVIPLAMGLVGGPASMISVGCSVIVYYVLNFIGSNAVMINSLDADGTLTRFRYLVDGVMDNKAMMITVLAFAVTILLVYIIRRLPVDHCWTYAMVAGALMNIVILMLGDLKYRTNISIFGTILGSIAAVVIVKILQFFVFNVDYSRTEHVQFEDDEYYYYVKAVPKMSVAISDKTVTRIDTRKPEGQPRVHSSAVVSAQQGHAQTTGNADRYTATERNTSVSASADSENQTRNRSTSASTSGTSRSRSAGTSGNSRSTTSSGAGASGSGRSTTGSSAGSTGSSRSTSGSNTRSAGSRSTAGSNVGTSGNSRSTTSSGAGSTGSSRSTTSSGAGTTGSSRSTGGSNTRSAGGRSTAGGSTGSTGSSRSTTGSTTGNRSAANSGTRTPGSSRNTTSSTASSRSTTSSTGSSRSVTSGSAGTTGSRSAASGTAGTNAATTSRTGGQS